MNIDTDFSLTFKDAIEKNNFNKIIEGMNSTKLEENIMFIMENLIVSCHYRFIKILLKEKLSYIKYDLDHYIEYSSKNGNEMITNLLMTYENKFEKTKKLQKKIILCICFIISFFALVEAYCIHDNYITNKRADDFSNRDFFKALPAQCCEIKREFMERAYYFFKIYF